MKISVLSPHRDDAAFSCAYLLDAALRAGAEIEIVTIFTRSDYAPFADLPAGAGREDAVSALRRREDEALVARLAGETRTRTPPCLHDLGWLDAPLRLGIDAGNVTGPIRDLTAFDADAARLAETFSDLGARDLICAPLALGGHIDHRLVRAAAERLAVSAGWPVAWYEDMPYACYLYADGLAAARQAAGIAGAAMTVRGKAGRREACALAYPSQIEPAEAGRMEAFSARQGYTELYWPTPAAAVERDMASLFSSFVVF